MPTTLFCFSKLIYQTLPLPLLNKVFENPTPCWYFAALSVKQAPWSK